MKGRRHSYRQRFTSTNLNMEALERERSMNTTNNGRVQCPDCCGITKSCDAIFIHMLGPTRPDDKWHLRISSDCNCSCGVSSGGTHHYGCEKEICPICAGILMKCNCKRDAVGTLTKKREIIQKVL